MLGEYQQAYALISQALALFQALGDKRLIELNSATQWSAYRYHSFLSMTTCALGNYAEAEHLAQHAIALSREISHRWGEAIALCNLGVATYYLGRTVEAGQHLHEGLKLFRMIEEPWGTALALNYLANGCYKVAAYNEAERCALEALEIATKARLLPLALEALVTLAAVRIQNDEKEAVHAVLLFLIVNLVLQHSASSHITKEKARHLLTELETYLSPALMLDHSRDMPQFEEIVAKALKAKQK